MSENGKKGVPRFHSYEMLQRNTEFLEGYKIPKLPSAVRPMATATQTASKLPPDNSQRCVNIPAAAASMTHNGHRKDTAASHRNDTTLKRREATEAKIAKAPRLRESSSDGSIRKMLAEQLTCAHCRKMVRPSRNVYRCLMGHFFCHGCKGPKQFGPSCRKCGLIDKRRRKIRPDPLTLETDFTIRLAQKYIERCSRCERRFYSLDDEKSHVCSRCKIDVECKIDAMWGTLDPELQR